jgi:hypothetical protein
VQGDAGKHLHIVGALAQDTMRNLAHQGEALREQVFERRAVAGSLA